MLYPLFCVYAGVPSKCYASMANFGQLAAILHLHICAVYSFIYTVHLRFLYIQIFNYLPHIAHVPYCSGARPPGRVNKYRAA